MAGEHYAVYPKVTLTCANQALLDKLANPGQPVELAMQPYVRRFLKALGERAVHWARRTVEGTNPALMYMAKESTRALRMERRKEPSALQEYGFMARRISFEVDAANYQLMVGIQPGIMSRPRRQGQRAIDLGILAKRLEEGGTITISENMHIYFKVQARKELKELGGRGSKDILASLSAGRAGAWLRMSGIPVGTPLNIPPRPFLRPGVEKALEELSGKGGTEVVNFLKSYWSAGGEGQFRGWTGATT